MPTFEEMMRPGYDNSQFATGNRPATAGSDTLSVATQALIDDHEKELSDPDRAQKQILREARKAECNQLIVKHYNEVAWAGSIILGIGIIVTILYSIISKLPKIIRFKDEAMHPGDWLCFESLMPRVLILASVFGVAANIALLILRQNDVTPSFPPAGIRAGRLCCA